MTTENRFDPTEEQLAIIGHSKSAFISACPGAGKTRVLVERARNLIRRNDAKGRGLAFLSFTTAATSELQEQLRSARLLPSPVFPHFIGTFDSFLWRFFIAPFGVSESTDAPQLVPDKETTLIRPYEGARKVPLEWFDRSTGKILPEVRTRYRFRPSSGAAKAYETSAKAIRSRFLERGILDFDDVRELASARLRNRELAPVLLRALTARLSEVIVDEAQDCNPEDLEIIHWLKAGGVVTKVVCDPHQAIYGFRGGVTAELLAFEKEFDKKDQLPLTGNFRSSDSICKAIVGFRAPDARTPSDRALGRYRTVTTAVHVLAYDGRAVSPLIGDSFRRLVTDHGIRLDLSPVLAATWDSARKAVGHPTGTNTRDLTLRLAESVTLFHFAGSVTDRREALEGVHRVLLRVGGLLDECTYHEYLVAHDLEPAQWMPQVLGLIRRLKYVPMEYPTAEDWHARAKDLLAPRLPPGGSRTINQLLRWNSELPAALKASPVSDLAPKSIHSVKGKEFPAVCVVMTGQTTPRILKYLLTGFPESGAEDARKIYVAASRAQQLLVLAVPTRHVSRLKGLLTIGGAPVHVINL